MDVFCDRRLPDYFRERSWSEVRQRRFGEDSALGDFLNERMGVIWGYDLSALDFNFLRTLSFPQTWDFKKLNVSDILTEQGAPVAELVLGEGFQSDRSSSQRFAERVVERLRISHELVGPI